jgi:hypothetical protein
MYYALRKDSTLQVVSLGASPGWMTSPPAGHTGFELTSRTRPDAGQYDPADEGGRLRVGESGILTIESGLLRIMTDTEINDASLLDMLKTNRYQMVDARTKELIAQGFEFPASSGKIISMSVESQMRILGCEVAKDFPEMTYPIEWQTMDDNDYVSIADSATMHGMFLTGLGTLRARIDSGTAIKQSLADATTKTALDAIHDTR